MASKGTDLTIGVRLDSSRLPGQLQRVETEINGSAGKIGQALAQSTEVANGGEQVKQFYADLGRAVTRAVGDVVQQLQILKEETQNALIVQYATKADLTEEIQQNERLLELMRERHTFEAEMAQITAARQGNIRGVQQAILDGQLSRGEISGHEHLEGMRRIEDQQRVENQNRIKAELERKREEAEKGYDTSRARRERGREEYYDWETRAQKVGLQGAGQMESVAKEWRRNVQIIRGYKDLLTEEQKGGKQAMTDDERYKADVQYAQAKQKLHELQQLIRAAAQYTGVNLTKEDGSNKQKSMDLVAQEVGERYKERHKEYQDLVVAEGNAERALADARAREQEQARLEKENESAIKRRRAEEDATLAHRAEEQAKAAEQRAQVAIEEQTRRDEREELKQRKAEEQAEVDSVREMLRQNMKLLQERATEEQKPAVQALERLLTRADDEPKVFDQIRAAATPNQEMSMDADQARRYGRDLRLLRAGGLDTQEVLGFLNLKAHEEHRLQNVSQYDEKLKAMDEEDSQARETERRQRVESLQERAKRARSHANRQAEAAEKSARTSDEDPLPGLNESLHGAQEVMQQQSETAQGTVAALRQFNATVGSCGAAISAQQNRINQLVSENNAVKQKMDSIARMNIA